MMKFNHTKQQCNFNTAFAPLPVIISNSVLLRRRGHTTTLTYYLNC